MNDQKSAPKLGMLLGIALTIWAVACYLTHGPVILAYLGFQLATSGVFAWQMMRIEKLIPKHSVETDSAAKAVCRAA